MFSEKKIVTIGGGTGLSTMLRGLKKYTHNITAIVTVADDGGSSGILREELGMPAAGDIRKCISALAEVNPIVDELINYRFNDGILKGHPFGNIYLAALCGISESFEEAVNKMNRLFGVDGEILPVTNENVYLSALLDNGDEIHGEANIGSAKSGEIEKVFLEPENAKPADGVLEAIFDADMIIMGPGSLYTSIIPNLLVKDVAEAIEQSKALRVYVANIMTQPNETTEHGLYKHIERLENHAGRNIIDCVIANAGRIPEGLLKRYALEGAEPVALNPEKLIKRDIRVILGNLWYNDNGFIRHNYNELAKILMNLK